MGFYGRQMSHLWKPVLSLTAKADYAGSTAVYSVAQKIENYCATVSLTLFSKYTPYLKLIYILNFENNLFISPGLNTSVTSQFCILLLLYCMIIVLKDFYYNIYKHIYTHLSSLHINMWMQIFKKCCSQPSLSSIIAVFESIHMNI